jgi:hypothetical protein
MAFFIIFIIIMINVEVILWLIEPSISLEVVKSFKQAHTENRIFYISCPGTFLRISLDPLRYNLQHTVTISEARRPGGRNLVSVV